jgi:hypothetical protein
MKRNELREKIIAAIEKEVEIDAVNDPELGAVGEMMNVGGAADAILAIPEIAEALKLVVIGPHPLQRD